MIPNGGARGAWGVPRLRHMGRRWVRGAGSLLPRWHLNQWQLFLLFSGVAIAYAVASGLNSRLVPAASAVLLLMLAAFYLRLRLLLLYFVVLAAAMVTIEVLRTDESVSPGVVVITVVAALLLTRFVRSREALGIQGNTGEAMLIDLRDRLRAQAAAPEMGHGLRMESALGSANGEGFSGDFALAAQRPTGELGLTPGGGELDWQGALEVALVDVSGKGQGAGTRALLLGGGLSGLLATSRVADFLPSANAYLLRQEWAEGFATAVHAVVDAVDGAFAVRMAGHLPPLHFHAGTDRWQVLHGADDPALGLMPVSRFSAVTGRLAPGDALVLYTDGMVESRGADLTFGIDRLAGALARHAPRGFAGAAEAAVHDQLVDRADDRSVVVIWRG